jgi:hypothetical protein
MTVADKGHVLYWLDFGKSYEEVSEITGYSADHISILWDALGDDEFKRVAKEEYYARRKERNDDEVARRIDRNAKKKSRGKVYSTDGNGTGTGTHSRTYPKPRSSYSTSRHKIRSKPRLREFPRRDQHGGRSVIDGWRNHKDYKGE